MKYDIAKRRALKSLIGEYMGYDILRAYGRKRFKLWYIYAFRRWLR